jgi:tetratricopeptide (TPR) repeat protein
MAPSILPAPLRRPAAFVFLLALALAGGWLAWRRAHPPVLRVLLLDPELGTDAGLDEPLASALGVLVKDALEVQAGASVSYTVGVPRQEAWRGMRSDALVLRLAPRRRGEALALGASWAWVSDLQAGRDWRQFAPGVAAPPEALEGLVQALPLPVRRPPPAPLVPLRPRAFWALVEAWGGASSADYASARALLDRADAEEPGCAAIHFARGQLEFFKALQSEQNDAKGLGDAEAALLEGLQRFPRHPRGSWLLARLRTDTGNLKEALEGVLDARRSYPNALPLLLALTYAGRYAGLLDLAAAAEARADELWAEPGRPVRLQVTFLYRGDWDRYERSLWTKPGDVTNSTVLVFRGQLNLCRGRRAQALQDFREVSELGVGYAQFIRLGKVFRAILEGDPGARPELDALARSRIGLRVPDGEFILNLAEAYVLLGDLPRAQELAEKAFYAGFTCARWFETNPILAPLRKTPRWEALIQHVRERQAILVARFPARRWGLRPLEP